MASRTFTDRAHWIGAFIAEATLYDYLAFDGTKSDNQEMANIIKWAASCWREGHRTLAALKRDVEDYYT